MLCGSTLNSCIGLWRDRLKRTERQTDRASIQAFTKAWNSNSKAALFSTARRPVSIHSCRVEQPSYTPSRQQSCSTCVATLVSKVLRPCTSSSLFVHLASHPTPPPTTASIAEIDIFQTPRAAAVGRPATPTRRAELCDCSSIHPFSTWPRADFLSLSRSPLAPSGLRSLRSRQRFRLGATPA